MNVRSTFQSPVAPRRLLRGRAPLLACLLLILPSAALAGAPADEPPGFAVQVEPRGVVAIQGEQVTLTASVVPEEGFEGDVTLALGALPFGMEGSVGADGTVTLTLGRHTHVGDHDITVLGISEEVRESARFDLRVLQSRPLAAAFEHTLAVAADGSLYAWGKNDRGQLGLGHTDSQASPVMTGGDRQWVAVAGGRDHSVALAADGTLWATGSNQRGQLGTGGDQHLEFQQVGESSGWVAVAAGDHHSLAISADRSLWLWGQNRYGQLGADIGGSVAVPTRLAGDGWVAAAAGADHTVAVRADGTLWAWGYNGYGQLATGDTTQHKEPNQVGTDSDWLTVSAGGSATMALKRDGTVWVWGQNVSGQLGLGNNAHVSEPQQVGLPAEMIDVSMGTGYSVVLAEGGALAATGSGAALGTAEQKNINVYEPVVTGQGFVFVSAGGTHTVAITEDGTLTTWGSNVHGQLGLGQTLAQGSGSVSELTVRWP